MNNEFTKPIDLKIDPLFCEALFKVSPKRVLWYQRIHHIVMDGYGFSLITKRVASIYTSLINNLVYDEDAFDPLHLVLEEDLSYRLSDKFKNDQKFWLDQFSDGPEVVSLTNKAPRTSNSVRHLSANLSPSITHSLKTSTNIFGGSWFEMIIAATAVYVFRLTGSEDVILSLPMMGRLGSVSLNTPSMIMNLLPLRLLVKPDMSFSELVKQVTKQVRLASKHQKYRHEELRRDLKLISSSERLAGIRVNIMPFQYGLDFDGIKGITHKLATGPVDDLSINVYDMSDGNGLRIDLESNPEIYSDDDLAIHQNRFISFLEKIATSSQDQLIGNIDLLLNKEREQVLINWNKTFHELPSVDLKSLLEEQVSKNPELTALVCGDTSLSYKELNKRAKSTCPSTN